MTTVHHPRFITLAVLSTLAGSSFLIPTSVRAENPAPTAAAVETVSQPSTAVVNEDNVYVRSGPGEIFYATTKLNKGAKITVVATRKDWVKIIPPDGSFCYVARAYVDKRGDGTIGRVTKADLNVRAGSSLNGLKTTVQTSLAEGDDVKILPDQGQDEYFKISPPPGAFLYMKKAFVDIAPDATAQAVPIVASAKQSDPIASEPVPPAVSVPAPALPLTPDKTIAAIATTPTTNPTIATSVTPKQATPATQSTAIAAAPATQPSEPTAEAKFDTLESQFLDATNQPLEQQPINTLLTGYNGLAKDSTLASSMKRIVDMRVATLKLRGDAQKQYADAVKLQADARAKQVALKAESDELIQRVKDQSVTIYTALGTLRISSLQQSGTTLYRLTDPGTGRTLVYIKSNDAKYAGLLNKFIGVKGDITEDNGMNLKFISPKSVDTVDQAKVNTTVTATVIPPSLLTKTAAVGTDSSVIGN